MTPAEERALLELLAACSTVFSDDENPFQNPTTQAMALRRIEKPTRKAIAVFSSAKVIGRGK